MGPPSTDLAKISGLGAETPLHRNIRRGIRQAKRRKTLFWHRFGFARFRHGNGMNGMKKPFTPIARKEYAGQPKKRPLFRVSFRWLYDR
jgi:hypothetical protein